ncbi:nucleolar protein 11 [Athalia rosae]|uniref:nucleolar protein 11 n=1 Tax=Athalia rosae TaxID=37344 RepID=UPI0020347FC9|nr:nucleolar protein 11 [Athalia rosae]
MAKLSSYYTLCPLIDQQNLLGVEKDSKPGCVVVTLGKNIVIRYKLQDLKQLSSWSSSDRLTTQVIYDEIDNRYVAVFNENHIRVWNEHDSDLDKVKKHKFQSPFYTILRADQCPPILVRQNGSAASLSWALANRKSWNTNGILIKGENIKDCKLININKKLYLCMLTNTDEFHNYIMVPLNDNTYVEDGDNVTRIKMQRTSENLVGHTITQDNNNAYLLTLWSHGRLYSYPLIGHSAQPPPGNFLSVVTALSTKHPVIMVPLNNITIAAYGADVLEEGAVLIIYNLSFKLAQATQKLKLYTKDAKMWRVEDKLLLAANRHLAIAPYNLTPQRIEAMVGSSRHIPSGNDKVNGEDDIVVVQEMEIASWGTETTKNFKLPGSVPKELKKQLSMLVQDGLPESAIVEILIPPLVKSKDIKNIIWFLNNFGDIPEQLLVQLLSFCLTTSDDTFDSIQNGFTDSPQIVQPTGRVILLNSILSVSYSDVCLLTHLKASLGFNEILILLNYLRHTLDASQEPATHHPGTSEPTEEQLLDWASLLLDSHYQQYLLSQDPKICTLLEQLTAVLDLHFQFINDLETLRPMIERLRDGKSLVPTLHSSMKYYSIEEVKLY